MPMQTIPHAGHDESYRRRKDGCAMSSATVNFEFSVFVGEMSAWAEDVFAKYTANNMMEFP